MNRIEEQAITVCILDLAGISGNTTETVLDNLNSRISEILGVELRDYTRSVDEALALVPNGWGGEITWTDTLKRSSVVLAAPNPDTPASMQRLVSHSLRDGVEVHYPLPVSICLAALKVHLLIRKRAKPGRNAAR
jgi:hypothetical protein